MLAMGAESCQDFPEIGLGAHIAEVTFKKFLDSKGKQDLPLRSTGSRINRYKEGRPLLKLVARVRLQRAETK